MWPPNARYARQAHKAASEEEIACYRLQLNANDHTQCLIDADTLYGSQCSRSGGVPTTSHRLCY